MVASARCSGEPCLPHPVQGPPSRLTADSGSASGLARRVRKPPFREVTPAPHLKKSETAEAGLTPVSFSCLTQWPQATKSRTSSGTFCVPGPLLESVPPPCLR